jgi:hypothetical protein
LNGFADCQTYIVTYGDVHVDPWSLYEWEAFVSVDEPPKPTTPMPVGQDAMVVAIAQNQPGATVDRTPLQSLYRSDQHEVYFEAFRRYCGSGRRAAIRAIFPSMPAPAQGKPGWIERLLGQSTASKFLPGHKLLGRLGSPLFLGRPGSKR